MGLSEVRSHAPPSAQNPVPCRPPPLSFHFFPFLLLWRPPLSSGLSPLGFLSAHSPTFHVPTASLPQVRALLWLVASQLQSLARAPRVPTHLILPHLSSWAPTSGNVATPTPSPGPAAPPHTQHDLLRDPSTPGPADPTVFFFKHCSSQLCSVASAHPLTELQSRQDRPSWAQCQGSGQADSSGLPPRVTPP